MATVGRLCDIAFKTRAIASPLIQTVRYRKPRWLPIAKSKEFYVREPTPIDPEEYYELKQRYSHYRSTVKSIRRYLKKELIQSTQVETALHEGDESADFAWMEQQTEKWNQRIASLREERQTEDSNVERERLQQLMSQRDHRKLNEVTEAELRLQEMQKISNDLITEENLEMEIEKMLDSRSDYNFALTKDGQVLKGEHPELENSRQVSQ